MSPYPWLFSCLPLLAAGIQAQSASPEDLIQRLSTKDLAEQQRVVNQLASLGPKAAPALIRWLGKHRFQPSVEMESVEIDEEEEEAPFPRQDRLRPFRLYGTVIPFRLETRRWSWPDDVLGSLKLERRVDPVQAGVLVLGHVGRGEPAVDALFSIWSQHVHPSDSQAARSLARIGVDAGPALMRCIDWPSGRRALAELGAPVVPELRELARKNGEPRRRIFALKVLAMAAPAAKDELSWMVRQFAEPGGVGAQAMRTVVAHGEAGRRALFEGTKEASVAIRLRAHAVLLKTARRPETLAHAMDALEDSNALVSRYVAEALGHAATSLDGEVVAAVRRRLAASFRETTELPARLARLFGLATLRHSGPVPEVVDEALRAKEWQIRIAAMRALPGKAAARYASTLMRTALDTTVHRGVREEALWTLERFRLRGSRARRVAATLASSWAPTGAEPRVLEWTAWSLDLLASLGCDAEPALPMVLPLLDSENRALQRRAMSVLQELGSAAEPAIEPLLRLVQEDSGMRYVAATVLGRIGGQARAWQMLRRRFDEQNPQRVRSAASMIRNLRLQGDLAREATRVLVKAYDAAGADVRLQLVYAIGSHEIGVPHLIDIAKRGSRRLRLAAIRMLRGWGTKARAAIPALQKIAAEDPEPSIRALSKRALKRIRQ